MAETIAELVASITGDVSGLQNSLKDTKNILGQASQDIMKLGAGLTAGFTTPVVGALGAVIHEAAGSEDALAQLDAVLKSTAVTTQAATQSTGYWADGTKKAAKLTEDYGDKIQMANAKLADMNDKLADGGKLSHVQQLQYQKLSESVSKMTGEINAATASGKHWVSTAQHIEQIVRPTKDQILQLASSFQQTTRFSDEAIIAGESMLLTFTKIGKDVFPLATQTMLDMSQALGQDLKGSAIQLGKALNDPIRGITALRRVGVAFSAEQEKQIKLLVSQNKLMEAQKIILNELQTEFGGSAEAMGSTFNGALVRIGNLFSDLLEKFGDPIIKALEPALNALADALAYMGDELASLDPETTVFIAAILGITAAIPPLITLFGALLSPIGLFVAAIAGVGVAIATNFGGLRDMVGGLLESLKPALDNVGKAFQGFFDTLGGAKHPIQTTSWTDAVTGRGQGRNADKTLTNINKGGIEGNATSNMDFGGRFKVAIEQSLPEIEAAFSELFNQIGTWFSEKGWPEIQKGISSWATKTKNEISTNLANSVQNAILGLINNIQSLFLSNPVGVGIINAIHNAINWVQTTAPGLAATAGAALKKALDGALAGVGAVIKEGVKAALSALVAGLALIPGAGSVVNTIQGAINAMASGGYADAMKPYMVGEHGAELFIPQTAGRVVPNTDIAGLSGEASGGQNIVIQTLNVYGVQDVDGLLDELQNAAQNRNMQLGVSYG